MADDPGTQIAAEVIVSEESVAAGVAAMERLHGHHLSDMSDAERADARDHWARQVRDVLQEVYRLYGQPLSPRTGRAMIWFTDTPAGDVRVTASFQPQLEEMPDDQLAGTPAQIVALSAFEAARASGTQDAQSEAPGS